LKTMQRSKPAPDENVPLIGFFFKLKPRMLSNDYLSVWDGKLGGAQRNLAILILKQRSRSVDRRRSG
jgi:hypothetical protein